MSFKKHFEVRRDTAKVEKIKEVKGDCLVPCVDTTETNDNGLMSCESLCSSININNQKVKRRYYYENR